MKFKYLSLRKNIINIKPILFCILLFTFVFISPVHAATYNYYFSNAGRGSICSEGSPCATLSVAQSKIDAANSSDTVNLYFKRGDIWSMNTSAVSTKVYYGLRVDPNDPIVNIDAYGSGNKPIFDGGVSDFSSVPVPNSTTGPLAYNRIFSLERDNCSIKNIKINGIYGNGIILGTDTNPGNYETIESIDVTNFGRTAIKSNGYYSTRYSTITKCLIHTGQQLSRYGKDGYSGNGWGSAIGVSPTPGTSQTPIGNEVSYNVLYDIWGEGIQGTGFTAEYNLIGDTGSVAIYVVPMWGTAQDTIIRYNFITMSSSRSYKNNPGGYVGIAVGDEYNAGANGATIDIYGNTIINRYYGVRFTKYSTHPDNWAAVRIYNNTIIDSDHNNIYIGAYDGVDAGGGYIENNVSILYDRTGSSHAEDQGNPGDLSTYWTIDNNAFWTTGGSPTVDVDWQTNDVTGDPKFYGEEKESPVNWNNLSSGDPRDNGVTFADVIPNSSSSLIDRGKILSWNTTLLTLGTDFSVLPDTLTLVTTSQQTNDGTLDIGAITHDQATGSISAPKGLMVTPRSN